MNKQDYNNVRRLLVRFDYFLSAVKEILPSFANSISELEEDIKKLNEEVFPDLSNTAVVSLNREVSQYVVKFYGENSVVIKNIIATDHNSNIVFVSITTSRPGVLIGMEGRLYDQLTEYLSIKLNRKIYVIIKEDMWNILNYQDDY